MDKQIFEVQCAEATIPARSIAMFIVDLLQQSGYACPLVVVREIYQEISENAFLGSDVGLMLDSKEK